VTDTDTRHATLQVEVTRLDLGGSTSEIQQGEHLGEEWEKLEDVDS
jgi:hypothetical protein